eukprot:CAMPEP_0118639838 /NCGR_PEP_ID=MMETSP0785-20121206/4437_1 /TAXON_ID=91992 /ORGANISM="Bolidomonas pacifica, Strain CCMP 1866" /LENGTH=254 /DNA_ID=CAMNT_0006531193 /DNA_START=15 /DNA_END=776 /DNA_ORIENTATION=-
MRSLSRYNAQAKLLFLYFLRSSAFAITSHNNINLRVARSSDISEIAATNLATLPENYALSFYNNHLRTWPNLALVAEAVPEDGGSSEVIAYVLGKVDSLDTTNHFHRRPQGHVTSLAVMKDYRRLGLGGELMNQLHHQMSVHHNVDKVGLHVRISNEAATKLYEESMGYEVSEVIKGYYQDGEDAYLMTKPLERKQSTTAWAVDDFHSILEKKKQEKQKTTEVTGNDVFALPRMLRGREEKEREIVGAGSVVGA